MAPADDLDLLAEAAVNGDDVALAELVRLTQPVVWRVCRSLGSPGEEEDLVQETYLRAMRSLPGFRGDCPVRAWLVAVARNVCADHVRRRARRARLQQRLEHEHDATPVDETDASVHGLVDELAGVLSPERRDAFLLTQVVGFSYEEAAAALGCPVGTIRSRVARARADLMAEVQRADVG